MSLLQNFFNNIVAKLKGRWGLFSQTDLCNIYNNVDDNDNKDEELVLFFETTTVTKPTFQYLSLKDIEDTVFLL